MKRNPITQTQTFVMGILSRALGESFGGRTREEYERIKARIPKSLKVVHGMINDELAKYAQTEEFKSRQFCRFRAGDKIIRYESYPTSISMETVRQALVNYGWREPRVRGAA